MIHPHTGIGCTIFSFSFEKLKERKKKCDRFEEVGEVRGNDESSSFKKLKQKWMNEWMFGAQTNSSLSWKKRKFSDLIKMEEKRQNKRRCNIFLAFYLYSTTRPMYKFCFFLNEFCFTKSLYKIVIDTYSLHWRQWSWKFQYFQLILN